MLARLSSPIKPGAPNLDFQTWEYGQQNDSASPPNPNPIACLCSTLDIVEKNEEKLTSKHKNSGMFFDPAEL